MIDRRPRLERVEELTREVMAKCPSEDQDDQYAFATGYLSCLCITYRQQIEELQQELSNWGVEPVRSSDVW